MTNQTRPFPAIVDKLLGQIYTLASGNESLLKVKARSSEEWFAHRDAELLEANKVLLQAIRQLVEDGMPAKKHAASDLNMDMNADMMEVISIKNKGYNEGIAKFRSTLLRGLE